MNRNTQQEILLTPFKIISKDYNDLEANGQLTTWENRAKYLNERPPHIDFEINSKVKKVRRLTCGKG